MGLGPAPEPLLAVAGRFRQKDRAVLPRGVFVPFSPPLSQFSAREAALAHWPPGEPLGDEGTGARGFAASERRLLSGGPNSLYIRGGGGVLL